MKRGGARKQKSRMVSFRVDEDDFVRLDALARKTSCSRAEVLRRCLQGVRLKSTTDAQALTAVSRVHATSTASAAFSSLLFEKASPQPTTSSSLVDSWRLCTRRTPAPAATAPTTLSSHFIRKTEAST